MTDIPRSVLQKLEQKYGKPVVKRLRWQITNEELAMIRASQKDGRAHDVTLFIFRRDKVAVIRKPNHPPGVYRAPSGAVRRGEEFEAGVLREAYEETGLQIELSRYLLRVRVTFVAPLGKVDWTTHVFSAKAIRGRLNPVDKQEIQRARWVSLEELKTKLQSRLINSQRPLLRYRAWLTEQVLHCLNERVG